MATQTELLLSDTRGIYIPRDFAQLFSDAFDYPGRCSGWTYYDAILTLLEGPEVEYYWDAWQAVLDNARLIEDDSVFLYQDGDLFMIPESDIEMLTELGLVEA